MKTKMISMIAALAAFAAFGVTPNTEFHDIPGTYKLGEVLSAGGAVTSETDPTVPAWAKEETPPQTMTTNAVRDIANATIATNALTIATTNRVAELETATNNLSYSVSGLASSKADKTTPSAPGNLASLTADGNLADSGISKTNVATKAELTHKLNDGGEVKIERLIDGNPPSLDIGNPGSLASWFSVHPFSWHIGYRGVNEAGSYLYGTFDKAYYLRNKTADHEPTDKDEIAVKGDISAENSAFANAVLAVGLNIDTNSVAVLNEIADTFGGFPIEGTATTVGGLLAALAAAIAWLKKNKVQTLKLNDNSVETSAENGVAKLDDFFTESNGLLIGTIAANSARLALDEEGEIIVTMNTED